MVPVCKIGFKSVSQAGPLAPPTPRGPLYLLSGLYSGGGGWGKRGMGGGGDTKEVGNPSHGKDPFFRQEEGRIPFWPNRRFPPLARCMPCTLTHDAGLHHHSHTGACATFTG